MRTSRGLASLIWAAVFVIAAQFVVDAAFAHPGHSHDASLSRPSAAHHEVDRSKLAPVPQVVQEQNENLSVTSLQGGDASAPAQSGGCTGGCCGKGIGCCGAVITAALHPLPDLRAKDARIPLIIQRSSGIHPEALRRPPRTIA
jgi:hypothetical protein